MHKVIIQDLVTDNTGSCHAQPTYLYGSLKLILTLLACPAAHNARVGFRSPASIGPDMKQDILYCLTKHDIY